MTSQVFPLFKTCLLKGLSSVLCACVYSACYHACKKCSGPEDYKCLDCKPGWSLHDHKCVGESGLSALSSFPLPALLYTYQ
uniref:PSI domain-containing protein n=1 Tax=Anguilla anguilla TaxID=7936 RepID=A0A0E9WAT3_ANGAN